MAERGAIGLVDETVECSEGICGDVRTVTRCSWFDFSGPRCEIRFHPVDGHLVRKGEWFEWWHYIEIQKANEW